MSRKLPWKAFLWALGFVVTSQVTSTNPVPPVFAAEKVSDKLTAVRFVEHAFLTKVRLGAAYLLRPEVAQRADVVWAYDLTDEKVWEIFSEELPISSLYFKAPGSNDSTVLSPSASKMAIEKSGSLTALMENLKGKGIEVGVVLDQPKWHGLEPDGEFINWKDSSEKYISFPDEAATLPAINELLKTGNLKKLDAE